MRKLATVLMGILGMLLCGSGLSFTLARGEDPRVGSAAALMAAMAPTSFTLARGEDPRVGDTVMLVQRDLHVPAHPGPGVSSVPFRFASGSRAEVLAVDEATGWLQIRGDRIERDAVGWITAEYVASIVSSDSPPPDVSWCPPQGSPTTRPGRLRIATWNLANLNSIDGRSTYTNPPSEQRFALDYERIRCYIRAFDPDILAVQEVDGVAALRRVVDEDVYEVHVSARPQPSGLHGGQETGFAFKRGLAVQPLPDVQSLDVSDGDLRYGARIDVTVGGQTLSLMSVHLKSSCVANTSRAPDCATLFAQLPHLEEWVDTAALGPNPFIVLGDFNRRLNQPGDRFWADLNDGEPASATLTALTENMPISCRDNRFTEFIDHIVTDPRATALVDRSSFRHVTFRQEDRRVWDLISDHCPVVVELWIP